MEQQQPDDRRSEHCLGCSRIETNPVTLRDGTVVCNECEAYRHEEEVAFVVRIPSNPARREYLDKVEKARGKESAGRLRADAWALMQCR